jgi:uncharacterized protein
MSQTFIADTGFLVALLSRDDQHHTWAVQQSSTLQLPLLTCEAVLTETCFLLSRNQNSHRLVFALLERGILQISFTLTQECTAIDQLMTRYASVPMSLADACLVRMVEQIPNGIVLALDGDFFIYRKNANQTIPVLYPPSMPG